jgi:hypothetical protein
VTRQVYTDFWTGKTEISDARHGFSAVTPNFLRKFRPSLMASALLSENMVLTGFEP